MAFKPWVGNKYFSENQFGIRILLLGESHYGDESEDENFTIDVVKKWGKGEELGESLPFFKKIAVSLLNLNSAYELSDKDREEFWDHVAFYNYIQTIVGEGPRERPIQDMWEESKPLFYTVLDHLKPDLIIVLGKELSYNIPEVDIDICVIQHPSTGFSYSIWNPKIQESINRVKVNNI
ncbi:hypothetical protein GLP21_19690 [Photobacterium carnosum]|uniref:hypothetical protein n=1 Tax=Photobacterium TaxID=657 RepID=UPI001E60B4B8|nr:MULTISPECIES: hypothetical protein [Photobacterium]MCD9472930.1 hypothetical protein [Photobacterium phosphoreum]MCD9550840.1 hypothetical protein [Photobacterium carnosum]